MSDIDLENIKEGDTIEFKKAVLSDEHNNNKYVDSGSGEVKNTTESAGVEVKLDDGEYEG
jgi:hypothetical protein